MTFSRLLRVGLAVVVCLICWPASATWAATPTVTVSSGGLVDASVATTRTPYVTPGAVPNDATGPGTPTETPTDVVATATPDPNGTATPVSYPTSVPPTVVPTATGIPLCGSVDRPCYTKLEMPIMDETHGAAIIGGMIVYAICFFFLPGSMRLVTGVAYLVAVVLAVLSGASAFIYGWLLFMAAISFLGHMRRIFEAMGVRLG